MGVNRPSLYAAFGDKEALFRTALDRYLKGSAAYAQEALREPTARAVVERLLLGAANLNTARHNPGGCLIQGALACGEAADSIRQELSACRAAGEAAIRRRFERPKSEGDLPANVNPADLARYIATLIYGMALKQRAAQAELNYSARSRDGAANVADVRQPVVHFCRKRHRDLLRRMCCLMRDCSNICSKTGGISQYSHDTRRARANEFAVRLDSRGKGLPKGSKH